MSNSTVIGSWLTMLVSALNHYGVDSRRFFLERGIDNVDETLHPLSRTSISTLNKLWDDAIVEVGDPCFGLKAGGFVTPNTLSALGMAMWGACTIQKQLECFARYAHVLSDVNHMATQIKYYDDTLVSISEILKNEQGTYVLSECSQDVVCAMLHTVRRNLYKRDFSPIKVDLIRGRPKNPESFEAFFGCPVSYGHSHIRIYIDMKDATALLPGSSEQVARATERLLEEYVIQQKSNDDLIVRLRNILMILLPQRRATMEQVASEFHTSKRTFHRQLERRGTTFKEQVESFRRELVVSYMAQDELSLGDISDRLGFSSGSNFTRAFKRWTGQTPQAYRR